MNAKIEKIIRKYAWAGMIKANNINKKMGVDLGEERLLKWLDKYIKILDTTFKIISGASISLAIVWFFPVYLHVGYDRMILVVLVLILLQLRFQKIKVNIE